MRSITYAICGSGLSISGVLLFLITLADMDRHRIAKNGIMHQLEIHGGTLYQVMFVAGVVFVICGVFLLVCGLVSADSENLPKRKIRLKAKKNVM